MMKRLQQRMVVAACLIGGLALAGSVQAHGFGGPMGGFGGPMGRPMGGFGHGGPGGPGHGHHHGPGRFVKDSACVHDCWQDASTCLATARTDLLSCREATCSQESTTADAACATDRHSDECKTALQTLNQCLQPCRADYRAAGAVCDSQAQQCTTACPDVDPLPIASKDRACVAACWSDSSGCRAMTRNDAKACYDQCAPLATAARAECKTWPPLSACVEARQALRACTMPCQEALIEGKDMCREEIEACVLACPNAPAS